MDNFIKRTWIKQKQHHGNDLMLVIFEIWVKWEKLYLFNNTPQEPHVFSVLFKSHLLLEDMTGNHAAFLDTEADAATKSEAPNFLLFLYII